MGGETNMENFRFNQALELSLCSLFFSLSFCSLSFVSVSPGEARSCLVQVLFTIGLESYLLCCFLSIFNAFFTLLFKPFFMLLSWTKVALPNFSFFFYSVTPVVLVLLGSLVNFHLHQARQLYAPRSKYFPT